MSEQLSFEMPEVKNKMDGYKCDCCGQFVKIYSRHINTSMACVLLLIYRSGKRNFFHVENWIKEIGRSELRADFHKLRFWGFLEKKIEDRIDKSNRNGFYKISGRGIAFCEGGITARETALIFNNQLQGWEGKEVTIKECLGRRFSYEDLMNNN